MKVNKLGTLTGRMSSTSPNLQNIPRPKVPVLREGDLVRHPRRMDLGVGRVLRTGESKGGLLKVLVKWTNPIPSDENMPIWVTEPDLMLPNLEGKHGFHYPSELEKIDVITAIGSLDE